MHARYGDRTSALVRTSSTTESCGMAKRCSAVSTISAETIAKCQRDLDREDRALALDRPQIDGAADELDIRAHDIHADAAPGNIGHGRRGREALREDEFLDLAVPSSSQVRPRSSGRS